MVLYCRQWVWDTFRKMIPVMDVPVLRARSTVFKRTTRESVVATEKSSPNAATDAMIVRGGLDGGLGLSGLWHIYFLRLLQTS